MLPAFKSLGDPIAVDQRRTPDGRTPGWLLFLALLFFSALAIAAIVAGRQGDAAPRAVELRLLVMASAAAAGGFAWTASGWMQAGRRRGWRLIGTAMIAVALTHGSLLGSVWLPLPILWSAVGLAGGVVAGGLGLLGLFRLGITINSPARLVNVVVDGAITGLSVLVVTWVAVLEQFVGPDRRPSASLIVWAALGVGLGAVVLQQLSRVPKSWFAPMFLMVGAAITAMAASIAGGELGAGYATATPLASGLFIASFGLVALAPLSGAWGTLVKPGEPWFAQRLLPYLAASAAIVAVLIRYLTGGSLDAPVAVMGGTVAICVVLRQVVAAFDERDHKRALVHEATHDFLTQLPNRMLLHERLQAVLQRSPDTGRRHAVLVIDLDEFKSVNDALSHEVGDALLRSVADRLRAALRPADLVARLGGDEFAILLANTSADDILVVCSRIGEHLRVPVGLAGHDLRITCSIGVGWSTRPDSPAHLLAHADAAMYAAKKAGGNSWRVFDEGMQADATARLNLVQNVAEALENENLRVVYQPVVDLASGQVVAAEALLRWLDPVRGWISIGDAVPALEGTNLLAAVDSWVLRRACQQLARWAADGSPIRVHVNVSAREISDARFPEHLERLLRQTDAPPELLSIEVTESAAYTNNSAHQVLAEVRSMGITVAIDDFGTGYSALKRILDHEFDTLKIDRSFVADYQSPQGSAILQAVIAIADRVGLTTIAEGIETEEQARLLARWGCERGQGYYFSRPLEVEQFTRLALGGGRRVLEAPALVG